MSDPDAIRDSQQLREEIRRLLLDHPQAAPLLTAKHLQPRLSRRVGLRTISWHMHEIRKQWERCHRGNGPATPEAA
jgi:hypothetical protein